MRTVWIVFLIGLGSLGAQVSSAPELLPRVPIGQVDGLAAAAGEIYAVGLFSNVARPVLNLALVNPSIGSVLATPWLDDAVHTVIGDGNGGWYVGGRFTTASGIPRAGLARFLPNGSLDPNFDAPVVGQVIAMELVGAQLYVAGRFSAVGGFARDGLAVLDAASGAVQPVSFGDLGFPFGPSTFIPSPGAHALAVMGNTLYVAGFFESVSGTARHGFAAFDRATGALLPWFPSFGSRQFGFPFTITTTANAGLLRKLGGELLVSNGAATTLRSVDAISGAASALTLVTNAAVATLTDDGATLYLGGEFSTIQGVARNRLAAFDLSSGNLLPLSVSIVAGRISALAIEGSDLHVGGQFQSIAGTTTHNYARLDRFSGSLLPPDLGLTGTVLALAPGPGGLMLGGTLAGLEGTAREGLAAFDSGSGVLLPLSVDVDGPSGTVFHPRAIACRGDSVFFSGLFTSVQGQPRPGLAAVDRFTGTLLPFNPLNLSITENTRLVVGESGLFVFNPWQVPSPLTLLDATTGAPLWSVTGNQAIRDVGEGTTGVFVTGIFNTLNGQPAPFLARLDAASGARLPFAGALDGPGYGLGLVVAEEAIFVTGTFSGANTSPRPNFAAFDPTSGTLLPWAPATPAPAPNDLLLLGPTLVAVPPGGVSLAPVLLDRLTAQRLPWTPPPANQWAMAIAGSRLLRGGNFPLAPNSSLNPALLSHSITLTPATSTVLGSGCWSSPSTLPPPSLTSTLPVLGSTLTLTVEGPPLTLGALWFSLPASSPVSLGSNCFVHLDLATALELTTFITDPLGRSTRSTFLPPILSLDGLSFREQALLLPPTGFALTNALQLTLGHQFL